MKRWRVVALLGAASDDGRVIIGPVTVRQLPGTERCVVLRRPDARRVSRQRQLVEVRCGPGAVLARLNWRDRRAQLELVLAGRSQDSLDSPDWPGCLVLARAVVDGLYVDRHSMSAWEALR